MNKAETMENLRNRIDKKLASSEKDYLKWTQNQAICHNKHLTMN